MRRWMWYGAALLLVVGLSKLPFLGIDVAKLQPVEVVRLSKSGGRILVETDTGAAGRGGHWRKPSAIWKKRL